MSAAIREWMIRVEGLPGWREYRRKQIGHTLNFDDPFLSHREEIGDFAFPPDIEKQHAVVVHYLGLSQTIEALKECEFYFRRYPFRGLPVSRHAHITNVCEMYFSRFYEFRERLKEYFKAIKAIAPHHTIEVGKFIKLFDKVFDQELRARNKVHHHERFSDIAIDKVMLTDIFSVDERKRAWKLEHLAAYRKVANEWSNRVRVRGAKMEEFLEATASATLTVCNFLAE